MSDWGNTSSSDRLGAITSWFRKPKRATSYGGGEDRVRGVDNGSPGIPRDELEMMLNRIVRGDYRVGDDRRGEEMLAINLGWDGQGSMYDYLSEVAGRPLGMGESAAMAEPAGVALRKLIEAAGGGSTIGVRAPERDGMQR